MPREALQRIERNLIAGLPAQERRYDRASFLLALEEYAGVTSDDLHGNLASFLCEIVPVAEEVGAQLCIHPDDPAFSLFGLPRIVSCHDDARRIVAAAKPREIHFAALAPAAGGMRFRRNHVFMGGELRPPEYDRLVTSVAAIRSVMAKAAG